MQWISVEDRLPFEISSYIGCLFFEDIQESIIAIMHYKS